MPGVFGRSPIRRGLSIPQSCTVCVAGGCWAVGGCFRQWEGDAGGFGVVAGLRAGIRVLCVFVRCVPVGVSRSTLHSALADVITLGAVARSR